MNEDKSCLFIKTTRSGYRLLTLLCLILTLSWSACFAGDGNLDKVIINSEKDLVLWYGCDQPDEFNSNELSSTQKEKAFNKGLSILKKSAQEENVISQAMLALFYFSDENRDMSKSLYWANKCAEKGEVNGMLILWSSYNQGTGVIQDIREGVKWCFLAAAKGDMEAKAAIEKLKDLASENKYGQSVMYESKLRATKWMEEHKEAFFNPN